MRKTIAAILLSLILAVAGWELWPHAPAPVAVGVIRLTKVDYATFQGCRAELARRGWREGETISFLDPGPAGSRARVAEQVAEMLERGVDLLLVSSTPASQEAVRLARPRGVPVVFAPVNDPLNAGLVDSLRHPGNGVTGIRLPAGDDLRLVMLTRVIPGLRTLFLPFNPEDGSSRVSADTVRRLAPALALEVIERPVSSLETLREAFATLPAEAGAVFLPRDSLMESHLDLVLAATTPRRLPVSAPGVVQVRQGALLSYGFVHHDIGRQAGRLIDQILRGIPAGDLPVETAEAHLAVNLAAADRLGLTVPDAVLAQASIVVTHEEAGR